MNLKKLLSVLLIMTMVLSVSCVAQADTSYEYLVGPIDFTGTTGGNATTFTNLGFTKAGNTNLYGMKVDSNETLRIRRGSYQYDSYLSTPTYNTIGKNGIVVEFKLKYMKEIPLIVGLNGSQPLMQIDTSGDIKATDSSKTLCTVNNSQMYTYTAKIDYSTKTILFTIKDSSGTVLCNTAHVQSAGNVSNQMVAKSGSYIQFYMPKLTAAISGSDYLLGYLDDLSVRALEAEDTEAFPIPPVSITSTIVEEDYDGLSPETVTLPGAWNLSLPSGWGLSDKGFIAAGKAGTASIKATSDGSIDKYLEFNLNTSSDEYLEYMYYKTLNKSNYIQELTFKVEENVQRIEFAYRVGKDSNGDKTTSSVTVATLNFVNNKVYLGANGSSTSADFNFVPGTIYTARAFYAWDAHKAKIEITDGTKSVVLDGSLSGSKNSAIDTEAPYIRFWSDTCCDEGRKISIYNYNIYTTNEKSCEFKTKYSNFKLSKNEFEEGTITASVDVDANTSFTGYINNGATLYLAVYENGTLSALKSVKVSPEAKTFSIDNTIGANDTLVKAMLWNIDDGSLTPLFVSEELAKQ